MEPHADQPDGKSQSVRQLLRQQRELQEKRKFGLAPLAVDTETHQEISPNIPEFISRAPWYYGSTGPTLVHQRKEGATGSTAASDETLDDKVDRIIVKGKAQRYTPGACRNCGSRTHQTHECFKAKKKVGTVYTHRVTGTDIETLQAPKTYAQKRDRFVGEVGVDLMRGVRQEEEEADADTSGPLEGRQRRLEDVFGTRTAHHGGVEVKELPKYLHNLDEQDSLFFDPKTGSMRANPNTGDTTKSFQGDLERYRSHDYYNYVEAQYRFLTGQSKSFVDFEFDETMRKASEQQRQQQNTTGSSSLPAAETPQDVLLRSLYGTATPRAPAGAASSAAPPPPPSTITTIATSSSDLRTTPSLATDASVSVAATASSTIRSAALSWVPTHNGHPAVFGSFFDPVRFDWGYACCKATGKDAPACVAIRT